MKNKDQVCPVHGCEFTASIDQLITHVNNHSDSDHDWGHLGWDSATEYRIDHHTTQIEAHEETAEIAEDHGNYDDAITNLEAALEHAQAAMALTPASENTFETTARSLLDAIRRVETAAQTNAIDTELTVAENRLDDGDAHLLDGDQQAAAAAYTDAEHALDSATSITTDPAQECQQRIDTVREQLDRRQGSLDTANPHHRLVARLRDAREARDRGDTAFKNDNYQLARAVYQDAASAYEKVDSALATFTFDSRSDSPTTCDLCTSSFDTELAVVNLEELGRRCVCPPCTHFSADGILPLPTTVNAERAVIDENIHNLKTGDYGLNWTTHHDSAATETEPAPGPNSNVAPRDLLMELVRVYQTIDGIPTRGDLDDHTEFGAATYEAEFGSITAALETAGLPAQE